MFVSDRAHHCNGYLDPWTNGFQREYAALKAQENSLENLLMVLLSEKLLLPVVFIGLRRIPWESPWHYL